MPADKPAGALEPGKPSKSREGELLAALDAERAKVADYQSRLMYLQADFDNYRKRVQQELEEARLAGSQRLVVPVLTIVDELELALRSAEQSAEAAAIREGVSMVLKKLRQLLAQEGVERIPTLGHPYDPEKHEAVGREVSPQHRDGEIIEEIRAGYTWWGKVLRASAVRVAGKAQPTPAAESKTAAPNATRSAGPDTAPADTTAHESAGGARNGNGDKPPPE